MPASALFRVPHLISVVDEMQYDHGSHSIQSIAAVAMITGINNMRVGLDKLRKFGKDQKGFMDKAVDVAAGISGLGDGFDRTQRGVSRLQEAYQHFAGSKPKVNTTRL